jgi:uncharacterized protein (DUF362 family)
MTRRGFLTGAAVGGAAVLGGGLTLAGTAYVGRTLYNRRHHAHQPVARKPTTDGMPGPFPGRVIEVHHPGSVREIPYPSRRSDFTIDAKAVKQMVDRGMRDLTGADDAASAWRRFFQHGDVVGIKVNPVGGPYAITHHELVVPVVEGLKSAGVEPRDIILFERYADQFRGAGYEKLLRSNPLDGCRWFTAAGEYHQLQVDIEGRDDGRGYDPNIVGYDPDVFVHMGYSSYRLSPKDDRGYRSHMSVVVSRMINKFINLPVLKDHGSGGVTLALKNMSHGMFNNVARSHLDRVPRGDGVSGPNQCNTFIPTAAAHPIIRQKATLHIMDGLVGVYQGGPSSVRGCNWPHGSLFFATDPVAMDHVGWDIVDRKRVEKGMPRVAEAGIYYADGKSGRWEEGLDRRQPEHIILAGTVGLGQFNNLDYQRVDLKGDAPVKNGGSLPTNRY